MKDYSHHTVLELFAGHGVGVAIKELGANEHAVEKAPDAIATRRANGMDIAYEDVWDVHLAEGLEHDTQHGSPPCPSFSAAGKGSGRKQMPLILDAIQDGIWRDIHELRAWSDSLEDPRTGLTVVPLHYAYRFNPTYISLEQVPAVLPIWEAYAEVLRGMGYSVWVGNLQAEQYGVPQTRKRAILMARRDGKEARPPKPTHSRYYSHDPEKLDPGVAKWVSMADAIGSIPADRPSPTVTGGGCDDRRLGALRDGRPAGDPQFTVVSNYGTGGDPAKRGRRMSTEPAATITSKFDRMKKVASGALGF
ncbi:DNA cytosine methyltransferase [Microbacterium sp. zg-YB36]|uniref:DNA cytosine methyltransferase n=1 Tax=Microbacterium sp. zg-YB36 TaxID=2969407 RepID=UPI00214C142F|nr:DNA cytosine methyltransferase [Microbacterium sp. zg-YB36]MDL5351122.1 DNA cytosine methyltransferase [Microbacterium sp. zg-YB36]